MHKWYVQFGERLIGPISEKEIQKNIKSSQIPSDSYFCLEGDSNWYPALQLDFVRDHFSGEQISLEVDAMPERHWVVLVASEDGEFVQDGPYAAREILSKIALGDLDYSHRIWKPGFQTWERIGDVSSFLPSKLDEDLNPIQELPNEPILSGADRRELLQSVANFEGRDILEYAEEAAPSEALTEDLTKKRLKEKKELSIDEINQLSFSFHNKNKSAVTQVAEESTKAWLPKLPKIKTRFSFKIPLPRLFAVASLLICLGVLLHNFVKIEPSTQAVAEEKGFKDLQETHLRIYGTALQSLRPRLEIRSNYEREDQLHVEIIGRDNKILKNFRFHRSKSLAFIPGEDLEISLADGKMGDGFYLVKARLGNLKSEKEIFIGVKDVQFEMKLKQFNLQKRKRADLEEKILKQVNESLVERSDELNRMLDRKKLNSLDLKTYHNTWKRKFYDTAHTELKTFGPETSENYVYPDRFRDLKTLRIELWKATKDLSLANKEQTAKLVSKIRSDISQLN